MKSHLNQFNLEVDIIKKTILIDRTTLRNPTNAGLTVIRKGSIPTPRKRDHIVAVLKKLQINSSEKMSSEE